MYPSGTPGISRKVLTDNLRALEEDGLVDRTVYAEVPPRVVYSLSELGNTLRPVIDAMQEWGIGYKARLGQPESFRRHERSARPLAGRAPEKSKKRTGRVTRSFLCVTLCLPFSCSLQGVPSRILPFP